MRDVAQWRTFYFQERKEQSMSETIKSPTTFEEQIDKLHQRGCIIEDYDFTKKVLQQINYYRFTAYFLPFKQNDDTYKENTSFTTVYHIYEFDRKMRNLLFSVIEQIELMLRTQLSYYHAHKYGALGYLEESNFSDQHDHKQFLIHVQSNIQKNKKQKFVKHHIEKYDSQFPVWVMLELSTLGELSFFYSDMHTQDKKELSKTIFNSHHQNIESWLQCITILRNYCAHYSRLYYTLFPAQPRTPKCYSYTLYRRLFDYILVLRFLYPNKQQWNSSFMSTLKALIDEYKTEIELSHIGFIDNWEEMLTYKFKTITGTII